MSLMIDRGLPPHVSPVSHCVHVALKASRSISSPRRNTREIRRVFAISSSGFASSTTELVLLSASITGAIKSRPRSLKGLRGRATLGCQIPTDSREIESSPLSLPDWGGIEGIGGDTGGMRCSESGQ